MYYLDFEAIYMWFKSGH